MLAGSDVGVEGPSTRDGVVEAGQDLEAGVEDLGRLPLAGADKYVASAHLLVMHASEVGGDAAAGLGALARLLMGLEGAHADVAVTG